MHRKISTASARLPMRLVLIVMLMAGLALAADHCTQNAPTSAPTAVAVDVGQAHHHSDGGRASNTVGDPLCICASVPATVTAALLPMVRTSRLRMTANQVAADIGPRSPSRPYRPALSALCVLRT